MLCSRAHPRCHPCRHRACFRAPDAVAMPFNSIAKSCIVLREPRRAANAGCTHIIHCICARIPTLAAYIYNVNVWSKRRRSHFCAAFARVHSTLSRFFHDDDNNVRETRDARSAWIYMYMLSVYTHRYAVTRMLLLTQTSIIASALVALLSARKINTVPAHHLGKQLRTCAMFFWESVRRANIKNFFNS